MSESYSQNHYEILQLSPGAEQLVITKVYRLLAAYYHPDNKQTGDEEKFKKVLKAYEVLSDPATRTRYNLELFGKSAPQAKTPSREEPRTGAARSLEELKIKFGASGAATASESANVSERDLRNLLLMALYDVRRNTPGNPYLPLLVIAELLGCAVESLEFSNWYLKEKGYIKVSDSADFSISIAGVDYVESELLVKNSARPILSLPESRS